MWVQYRYPEGILGPLKPPPTSAHFGPDRPQVQYVSIVGSCFVAITASNQINDTVSHFYDSQHY